MARIGFLANTVVRIVAVTVLVALAFFAAISTARAESSDDYAIGTAGHRFRVRFDPASRIAIGISTALSREPESQFSLKPQFDMGLAYRSMLEYGSGPSKVTWQVDQKFVQGHLSPYLRDAQGLPAFEAALYEVSALRHDSSPRLVLPSSPPIGVPFPFDVGIEGDLGTVRTPSPVVLAQSSDTHDYPLHVGVIRAAFVLDPWRSGLPGRSVEIGFGARYGFDVRGQQGLAHARFLHRVAPMTDVSLRFRYQTEDGLAAIDVRSDVAPHWTSEGVWRLMASSSMRFERTLIAINDEPIAAIVEGVYRLSPPWPGETPSHEVRAGVGLSFHWQLR